MSGSSCGGGLPEVRSGRRWQQERRNLRLTMEILLTALILVAAWMFDPAPGAPWRRGLAVSLLLAGVVVLTTTLFRFSHALPAAVGIGVVYLAHASRLIQTPWIVPGHASLAIVPGIILAILVSCAWVLPDSDRSRNRILDQSVSLTAMLLILLSGLTTWLLLKQRLTDAAAGAASCARLLLLLLLFGAVSSIVARDGRPLRRVATLTLFALLVGLVRAKL